MDVNNCNNIQVNGVIEDKTETDGDNRHRERSLWSSAIVGIYGMVTGVLAIVIPISYHLGHSLAMEVIYDTIFYFYMFTLSILLMIYIMTRVLIEKTRLRNEASVDHVLPPIATSHEKLSHYRKFGGLVFLLVSLAFDITFLVGYAEDSKVMTCFGVSTAVFTVLRIIFLLTQSIFFVLHYSTILNFHRGWTRFAMVHLIATNMCNWGLTLLMEAATDEGEEATGHPEHETQGNLTGMGMTFIVNGTTTSELLIKYVNCKKLESTSASISGHLFAFMIELSMLAIGFCYDIYKRIGTKPVEFPHGKLLRNTADHYIQKSTLCYKFKYSLGLIAGLVVILGTAVASTMFGLIRDDKVELDILTGGNYLYLFYGTNIIVNILSLMFTVHALICLTRLHFLPTVEFLFDEILLVVSLAGTYFMVAMVITGAFFEINKEAYTMLCLFYIVDGVLTYFQTSLQYLLIRNGVHRRALHARLFKDKPGKAAIAFLMLTNFAQWIALSFMIVAMKGSRVLIMFYGKTTWLIFSNIFVPMLIFHRFHAGACLAEIFESCYRIPHSKTS